MHLAIIFIIIGWGLHLVERMQNLDTETKIVLTHDFMHIFILMSTSIVIYHHRWELVQIAIEKMIDQYNWKQYGGGSRQNDGNGGGDDVEMGRRRSPSSKFTLGVNIEDNDSAGSKRVKSKAKSKKRSKTKKATKTPSSSSSSSESSSASENEKGD